MHQSKVFHEQLHSFAVEDLVHLSGSFVIENCVRVPPRSKPGQHHRDPNGVDSLFRERPLDNPRRNALLDVFLNEAFQLELSEAGCQNLPRNSRKRLEQVTEPISSIGTNLPDNQKSPLFTQYSKRSLDGAIGEGDTQVLRFQTFVRSSELALR